MALQIGEGMRRLITVPSIEEGDVQALAEFLGADHDGTEAALHALLQHHPALLGVLGYVRLLSEFSLRKVPCVDTLMRRRDRVDFLGARPSDVASTVLYVDIIELKRTHARLAQRADKRRLSSGASGAITQLHSYERDLVENGDNRAALRAAGLAVGQPNKVLLMGRDEEFSRSSEAYESIKAQLRAAGIIHYTLDALLRAAERSRRERLGDLVLLLPPNHLQLVFAEQTGFCVSRRPDGIVAASEAGTVVSLDPFDWREVEYDAPCPRCGNMSLQWFGEGGAGLYGVWTCSKCGYRNWIDHRFDSDYDSHDECPF